MILPIDVGGLYRTLDGGKHWEQASVGWDARGCNDVAFDPRNSSRMIGLAGNSGNWDATWGASPHGIYLSTNKAASWKHVVGLTERIGHAAAYDATSFDAKLGYCTVAYVASPTGGLLRTDDGGETWKSVSDLPAGGMVDEWTPMLLRVHPKTGAVYLGLKDGLHVSKDGGKTFTKRMEGSVFGITFQPQSPDTMYVCGDMGLMKSADAGATFTTLAAKGIDREANNKPIRNVSVSGADPLRISAWVSGDNWKWGRYYSHDGGQTFAESKFVKGDSPMPMNVRQGYYLWDPRDKNIVYSLGGDCVTRSVDGGKTFTWYNNGYNGVMMGGMMNFSAHAPKTVFLAFQDYNSAATQDGGGTWNYYDSSGKGWGGHCYGGHAVDATTFFYGDAEGWGDPRRIRITHDAGKTWEFIKGADGKEITLGGANVSLSDPTDANILFCYDHRSTDKGKTWQKMADCDGVFTYSPATKVLFGRKGDGVIVRSKDKGTTWETVADAKGHADDIAVNHKTGAIFVAGDESLKRYAGGKWETIELPADQFGNKLRCVTVATDPRNPDTVYVGGPRNVYATHCTVARSTDGGKTWRNLTVNAPLAPGINNGPHEVSCIRVNPETGDAWVAGQCYGMWRIPAPAPGETGTTAALASAPKSLRPALAPMPTKLIDAQKAVLSKFVITINNGDMEAGTDVPNDWGEKWEGRGKIAISRDTTEHKSGSASLKVKTTGDTQGQAAQLVFDAPAGATFTISGAVKSKGNVKVNFAVQPRNDSWTPVGVLQVGYAQNDSDWQAFSKTVTLPEGSKHAAIILYVEGNGEAWLDDVKVSSAGATASANIATSTVASSAAPPVADTKPAPKLSVSNGDMEKGGTTPDGWDNKWEGRGKLSAARDTSIKHGGAASLRVDTGGMDAMGSVGSFVDAPYPGGKVTITGFVKSEGDIKVNFAAQPFSTDWKAIAFNQIGYVQNNADWQSFTKEITLPDGTARINVNLLVEGNGKAWLDDVKITDTALDGAKQAAEYQPQPDKLDPLTPMHGFWSDYPTAWLNYARSLRNDAHKAKPRIVFVGDSITQNWKDAGKADWDKRFAPLGAFNAGIGGDKTNQILWRIQDGLLDGLSPKLVVLAIGVNNMWRNDFGNDRIAEATQATVKAIQAKVPAAKVLVVGIFPTQQAADNAMRGGVKEINATVKKRIATMKNVRFVDFGDKFLSADGSISADIMPDYLHPNAKGYVIYGDNLEPVVKEMLK